jgi:hypothetical protein
MYKKEKKFNINLYNSAIEETEKTYKSNISVQKQS